MLRKKTNRSSSLNALLLCWILGTLTACSPHPYIPEGEQLYIGVKEIKVAQSEGTAHERKALTEARSLLSYKPSSSFLGLHLPFTYGYYIDQKFEHSKTFVGRWLYKTFGIKPRYLSDANPLARADIARRLLAEYGYFGSRVTHTVVPLSRDSLQARISYHIDLGTPYTYDSIEYQIGIEQLDTALFLSPADRLLQTGDYFSIATLEAERSRITDRLRSEGYYFFRDNNIIYSADTVRVPGKVQLRVQFSPQALPETYRPWRIGTLTYLLHDDSQLPLTDSLYYDGVLFRYRNRPPVRLETLRPRIKISSGSPYSIDAHDKSTTLMSYLNTFSYTDITYTPSLTEEGLLDVTLSSVADKPYFSELEGTFKIKNNDYIGPGLSFTVNKKNLFRGGEVLSLGLQTSYEWETSRSNRGSSWDINSYKFGLSSSLTFPRVLLPVLAHTTYLYPATTRLSLSGELLNRGDFYRLGQFSGVLSYMFEPTRGLRHTVTPLRLSYNFLMHSTTRFDELISANPILQLAFRNQFIATAGYHFGYETAPGSPHHFGIEANISEAGNLLSLLYGGKADPQQPYRFLGAPFAQYIKGTLESRYSYKVGAVQLATRLYAGQVYSFGNMLVAPYTEQFYAGGANSIRGFNVRSIGPGGYAPTGDTERYAMLDRVGDIRLEANAELRYRVTSSFEVATFLDAGNVWLLRPDNYRDRGTLSASTFLADIALGTGLGLRYDLNYLVLRLDGGIALHAPHKSRNKYFNTFDSGDWYAIHFAIGYPF